LQHLGDGGPEGFDLLGGTLGEGLLDGVGLRLALVNDSTKGIFDRSESVFENKDEFD
jgi:hypothetical protein